MKAIILAAGESKRLRPLTSNLPKCLLRINGKCIIDHQIDALRNVNIRHIIVVTGYKSDALTKHLKSGHPDLSFDFIENKDYQTTSAAYSLFLAKHHLGDDVIYLNSDVMFDPQIIELVINDSRDSVTALQRNDWNEEQVNITVDSAGKIVEIGKHIQAEQNHGEFIGVTKIGKRFGIPLSAALEHFVNQTELKKFAADAINHAIQEYGAEKYALDVTHLKAIEIDTPEDFESAQKIWG